MLRVSVWHFYEKSYRSPKPLCLLFDKSYLLSHFISFITHSAYTLFLLRFFFFFSSFCYKTCWFRLFKPKSLLVTCYNRVNKSNCCPFFTEFQTLSLSSSGSTELTVFEPISSEFARVYTGFELLWLWIVGLSRFVVD